MMSQQQSMGSGIQKIIRWVVATALLILLVPLASCQSSGNSLVLVDPVVQPPAINTAGVLRVGVDSSHPPYAGQSNNQLIGLDVDLAAALAEQLGLTVQIVDIAGQDANQLFQNGQIDVMLGYQPADETTSPFVLIGPYLYTGPAVFTVALSAPSGSFDPSTLNGLKIAAQADSASAYQVTTTFGPDALQSFTEMKEAFAAVAAGTISYVAADAVAGGHQSTRYENFQCLGFLSTPGRVYIAVAAGNQPLTEALTSAARTLRDNGILRVIVNKWLGPTVTNLVLGSGAIMGTNDAGSGGDTGGNLPDPGNANSSDSSGNQP